MDMFGSFRKYMLARNMKRLIRFATEAIYSEQFDMDATVERLSNKNEQIGLVRAYIAIQTATKLTEPLNNANVIQSLEELASSEQYANGPKFAKIIDLHKHLAETSWLQKTKEILERKLAYKNDEYCYAGMIYRLENIKRGPLSQKEREETKAFNKQIKESEHKLTEHLAVQSNSDLQHQYTEQQLREELDRLKCQRKLLDDPDTLYHFGLACLDGDGVEQDYVKAAGWFRMAAEQGHSKAQHNLGLMYENGQGVSRDYVEAAKWYRMAAEQGNGGSQNNLGCLLEAGNGVAQDYDEALIWYQKAAEHGDLNASSNINKLKPKLERDKYLGIASAFSDIVVAREPLIGDCSVLPYPKKTILYMQ